MPKMRTRRHKHPFRLSAPWRKVAAVLGWICGPWFGFGRKVRPYPNQQDMSPRHPMCKCSEKGPRP